MAERPSPLSIAIGTLILLHSDPTSPYYEIEDRDSDDDDRLSAFLHSLTTTTHTSVAPRRTVETEHLVSFGRRLEEATSLSTRNCCFYYVSLAAKSLDGLQNLMESFQVSIADAVILDPDSSRGIYLRQICLGFDRLSFEATTTLFQCLREELEEAMTAMITNPGKSMSPSKSTTVATTKWPQSAQQLDDMLRRTCLDQNQRGSSFEETELKIRQVLEESPGLPSAYFMRFLNCMQYGEKNGALEALHQYFDSAIIQERKKDGDRLSLRHDILQYAAILLAAVYHSFGDEDLSLAATDEAVRVAQQSRDGPCVAYALGWLFHNHRLGDEEDAAASATAQDLLQRCSLRATDDHLRSLVAGANLSLAQYIAQHLHQHRSNAATNNTNNYMPAAAAWSALLEASTDNTSATNNAGLCSLDRPTHIADLRQSAAAMQILVHQWMMSAGIWDAYGHTGLSGLYSFLPLHYHDTRLLSESDVIISIQNVAHTALYGSPSLAVSANPCDLFDRLEYHDDKLDPTTPCLYGNALAKLLDLWRRYNLPISKLAQHGGALILHEWAVRRGDLDDATALMGALESYLHPRMPNYHELVLDTMAQKSLLLSRQGHWDEAKALLKKLVTTCQKQGLRSRQARLLVQLAWMQFESSSHHSFTAALPPLLECLSLCEQFHLDGIHATALSILAKVHLRLFNSKRAIALLQAALPLMLQNEHIWYQAEAYLTLAKCYLQQAKRVAQSSRGEQRTQRLVSVALDRLEQSAHLFEKCQDLMRLREVLYLQARLSHSMLSKNMDKAMEERDAVAHQFVAISRYLQGSRVLFDGKTDCSILNSLLQPLKLHRLSLRQVPVA